MSGRPHIPVTDVPLDPHQEALIEAAARLGIESCRLAPRDGLDAVRYRRGERTEVVLEGKRFSHLTAAADRLARRKHDTKRALAGIGIPVPRGVRFADPHAAEARIRACLAAGPVVVKPDASEGGEGVRLDLRTFDEVVAHWRTLRDRHAEVLVEERVAGRDLRIQALAGRILAACVREPAHVVGDGRSTVADLVEARRAQMRTRNPLNRLDLDAEAEGLLAAQGLGLADVPAAGRRVDLKRAANLALGGVAVDVTGDLHPGYDPWVARIARRLGLRLFAVDVMTTDPARDPMSHARVIEVNSRPDWLHHTFSEGRTHDVAGRILEDLFGA